jgi:MSHA biogenesis protein MshG
MPRYSYIGKNQKGEEATGSFEASTEQAVALALLQQGIVVHKLQLVEELRFLKWLSQTLGLGEPTLKDLIILNRQLYALTRAGVPLVTGLRLVAENSSNKVMRSALEEGIIIISSGQSLAQALKKRPSIFPNIMTSLIAVAEATGTLEQAFKDLSSHFEREGETRKRLSEAVRYPITVIVVIAIAVGIINSVVIPAFSSFFAQFGVELPWATRCLIFTSNLTVNYWPWFVLILVGSVSAAVSYISRPEGRYRWDRWKLNIPILGPLMLQILLGRFARSFALTLRTGLPLLEGIQIVAKASDNAFLEKGILNMRGFIERGEALSVAAKNCGFFSGLVIQMISIGEASGEIDELLEEVALIYEEDVDYAIKRLADTIEPVLLIVVAGMVLILALGIFLPMWDLSQAALKHG